MPCQGNAACGRRRSGFSICLVKTRTSMLPDGSSSHAEADRKRHVYSHDPGFELPTPRQSHIQALRRHISGPCAAASKTAKRPTGAQLIMQGSSNILKAAAVVASPSRLEPSARLDRILVHVARSGGETLLGESWIILIQKPCCRDFEFAPAKKQDDRGGKQVCSPAETSSRGCTCICISR